MASLPKRVGTINRLWKEGGAPYQSSLVYVLYVAVCTGTLSLCWLHQLVTRMKSVQVQTNCIQT